jgi:UDP-N-acetyl-D-mannosaminuronic acid dehydrogenase
LKVCVAGIGTVGFPTALSINGYHDVYGYDIDPKKVEDAKKSFPASVKFDEIPEVDVYILCVNTWWRGFPDMSAVEDVSRKIAERSNRKTLVSIESTVSVGTCRRLFKEIFKGQVLLSNCPHRFWFKDLIRHGVRQQRILGAIDKESMDEAKKFYWTVQVPVFPVTSIEASEMSKIVENTYRYLEIAYAEEVSLTCEKLGLSFMEIREACNTLKRQSEDWQVQIMEAKEGIGGTCLPKDIRFLHAITNPGSLFAGAIETDEFYQKRRRDKK